MRPFAEIIAQEPDSQIVVTIMNGMGDGFLALPLIRYIIGLVRQERVILWASTKYLATVFDEFERSFISIETHRFDESPKKDFARLKERLSPGGPLVWISLNSYPCSVEAYAIDKLKPGYIWSYALGKNICREVANGPLIHRRDQYFRVIGEKAMPAHMKRTPAISSEAHFLADTMIGQFSSASKGLVAIHADTRRLEKQWKPDYWIKLCELLSHSTNVFLLGLPDEPLAKMSCGFGTFPTTWTEHAAVLARADAFVGIDSCFAHVADAFGIPGVVLFGGAIARDRNLWSQWRPIHPRLISILPKDGDLGTIHPEAVAQIIGAAMR